MRKIYTIVTVIIIFSLFIGFIAYLRDIAKIEDAHDSIGRELGIENEITSIIYMSKDAVDLAHPKRGFYVSYVNDNGMRVVQLVEGTDSIVKQWKTIRRSMTEDKFTTFTLFWIMVISFWAVILSLRLETIGKDEQ